MTQVLSPLVSRLSVASKFIVFSGFRKKVSQQRRPSISTELRMSFSIFRETRHLSSQTRTLWRYLLWKNENNKKVYKPQHHLFCTTSGVVDMCFTQTEYKNHLIFHVVQKIIANTKYISQINMKMTAVVGSVRTWSYYPLVSENFYWQHKIRILVCKLKQTRITLAQH